MHVPEPASPYTIRPPSGADAGRWDSFIAREQARTYAGRVPADFERRALEHWRADPESRRRAFDEPLTTVRLIAEADGEIVGAAEASDAPADWEVSLGLTDAPADRELSRLYLAASAQGSGLASELLRRVIGDDDVYLWIIEGNDRAERFYRRHGFAHHGPAVPTGESWGGIPMRRMVRRRHASAG